MGELFDLSSVNMELLPLRLHNKSPTVFQRKKKTTTERNNTKDNTVLSKYGQNAPFKCIGYTACLLKYYIALS